MLPGGLSKCNRYTKEKAKGQNSSMCRVKIYPMKINLRVKDTRGIFHWLEEGDYCYSRTSTLTHIIRMFKVVCIEYLVAYFVSYISAVFSI